MPEPLPFSETVSMYDDWFDHRQVADSKRNHKSYHSVEAYSAALLGKHHGAVPFGTKLPLSYQGRKVVIVVNDTGRGKDREDRVLDLSHAARNQLAGHPVTNSTAGLINLASIQVLSGNASVGPLK